MRFFECLLLLLLLLCSTSISTHFRSRKKMPTNLELRRPQHHFGKAQKPSRAVEGRHDFSAPDSAVLTLKQAAEIYGANYAAHSTISERPRNHQGRLKGITIFRPQIQPNYAAHSTISERPRNHQGRLKGITIFGPRLSRTTPPTDHFGKAQKPSRAVKGRRDFSAPISAVLTLKRASEIYGANYAAHNTISERPRNHQGRLKDVTIFRTTPPTDHFGKAQKPSRAVKGRRDFSAPISAELRRPQHHFGKAQKPSRAVKGRHDFSAPNSAVLTLKQAAEIYGANYAAHSTISERPRNHQGRLKGITIFGPRLSRTTPPTDHFGKAQKPSRAVKGRRDFSAPISAVLTLKRASEIYGANYAAHNTISERPRNHQGRLKDVTIFRTTPPTDHFGKAQKPSRAVKGRRDFSAPISAELRRPQHHFGKAQKPSRAVKGRHDFSAPNSAVLTLKQAAEIYGANYAAHSTISERPRNHQGRLKGITIFGPRLSRTTPPTDHFGKAQKPSRAVKGRRDFSAPISAVLTLKRASEIYGANYAAHNTISERPRNHQGRLKDVTIFRTTPPTDHFGKAQKPSRAVKGRRDFSAPISAVLTLKRASEIYGANYAAHSTISERPRNHQGRLKDVTIFRTTPPTDHFGKAQKPSRAVKGRRDFSAPISAVLTLKRASEIYGANYAAHSTISERPRNHQGRLKDVTIFRTTPPTDHFGKAQKPSRAVKGRRDFSAPISAELRRPQHHFGKAQKPSRAVKGRHDFSAPNSAVLTLKRAAEIYGANYAAHSTISERPRNHQGRLKDVTIFRPQIQPNYAAHRPFRKGPETIKDELRRPQHHFGKAQKPSRAVKGRHDFSAPNSAVLTLKRAAEIYGANYAAHSTISERPRNHQGRLKDELRRPQTISERPRNHQGRLKDVPIFRHQFQPNYAAHSTISERPRNHQGRLKDELRRPQHHFGKAQKPSRAVKGHHDFSAPDSAVLTLKRAAEIYGANYAAHSTISERPRNHQGRLKDVTIFRPQIQPNYAAHSTISERPRNHQGRLKDELRRPQTISERPRNHQGRLKDELRRPQHHFGKAQKPSRAVKGRHDFSAPNSAVLTLKQAAEIYGANYAAHSTISERPRNHQGRLKDELRRPQTISERPRNHQGRLKDELRRPQYHFGKAQKPSRAVKGRHDFSAPNSAVLTLKRAAEIYGANYAAHSTISERPRNHQGRLKDELRRPQTISERPRNHQGRLKDELRRPQYHFGKAQKPSRAVKGRHDFSAPNSAVLTLKRAAEIYGANYAAHSTISERPRNHQGRLKDELRRPQTISERPRNHQGRLKDVAIFRHQFQPNYAAHSTISERPRNHQGRLKDELRRPQHHFGKAQKPSRAVKGRHDFSAPNSAVLTLKRAAEIYGA
ncbi:hypothetical protein YC2023_121907 [Brassica napus]